MLYLNMPYVEPLPYLAQNILTCEQSYRRRICWKIVSGYTPQAPVALEATSPFSLYYCLGEIPYHRSIDCLGESESE
jgi:hypothetical protein